MVSDWAYLVPWAFREALDIRYSHWIDEAASIRAQDEARAKGRPIDEVRKIRRYRGLWTQGTPPIYNFSDGDTLHHRNGSLLVQVLEAEGSHLTVLVYAGRHLLGTIRIQQSEFIEILQGKPVEPIVAAQEPADDL